MTDRELLELAAKAAGLQVRWIETSGLRVADSCNGFAGKWNPLTDDGDALRLAVKLRMEVETWIHGDSEFARVACQVVLIDEPHNNDPCAATRRAIVRAAAEIGRSL